MKNNLEMELRKTMVALSGLALIYSNFCLLEAAYIVRCDGYLSTTETDTLSVGLLIGAVGLINWLVFKTKASKSRHYFKRKGGKRAQ